jgi:hypothetical protein
LVKNPLFASFFFLFLFFFFFFLFHFPNEKWERQPLWTRQQHMLWWCACVCLIYRKAKVGRRKRDRYLISPIRSYNNPATAKSAPKSFDQPFHFARATTDGALQFCNYVFYKPPERERETLLFLSHTINFLKFFDDGAKAGKNMPFFSLPSLCICFFCVSRQNQSCV